MPKAEELDVALSRGDVGRCYGEACTEWSGVRARVGTYALGELQVLAPQLSADEIVGVAVPHRKDDLTEPSHDLHQFWLERRAWQELPR